MIALVFSSASTIAAVRGFNFIPPQQAVYWNPPADFGEVAAGGWEPPTGYEKTEQPWTPPAGFTAPPKGWEPPSGWGRPPEWGPPEEFRGKVIREKMR
jgi:hypothetical protein